MISRGFRVPNPYPPAGGGIWDSALTEEMLIMYNEEAEIVWGGGGRVK